MWTFDELATNDTHIQGGCYVTESTIYKKSGTAVGAYCHTATAFDSTTAGTRIDYVLMANYLLTFTKTYSAGFYQNAYGATLEQIILTID